MKGPTIRPLREELMTLSVRVARSLHSEIAMLAAREQRTIQEQVRLMLAAYVENDHIHAEHTRRRR